MCADNPGTPKKKKVVQMRQKTKVPHAANNQIHQYYQVCRQSWNISEEKIAQMRQKAFFKAHF